MSHKKSLRERLLAFETALNDKADIFAGEALKNGKGVEKALKGRSNLANGDSDEPILTCAISLCSRSDLVYL